MLTRARVVLALSALTVGMVLVAPRAPVGAGVCAHPGPGQIGVVPTAIDVIPRGEGILVHLVAVAERSLGAARDGNGGVPAFDVGARLERDGHAPIQLGIELLGPSVARLVPAHAPEPGGWRVTSGDRSVAVTFGASAAPAVGAAPHLVAVWRWESASRSSRGGPTRWSSGVVAELQETLAPPAVRGIVLYGQDPSGREVPLLGGALEEASAIVGVYQSPGRCSFGRPGQAPPAQGRRVRLATYDLWGRLGPRSNEVVVSTQ